MPTLRTLHLFAGGGGGILADKLLGHHPVCAVEIDGYCQRVLLARQKDGHLPWFPVFADIREFDGNPWRGLVDLVAGGFPCTDISPAGLRAGIDGEQSGLWVEMARVVGEIRPRFVLVENSAALVSRGLGTVLGGLSELGYSARWGILGARHSGAFHRRDRVWIVAYTDRWGREVEREQEHRYEPGEIRSLTDRRHPVRSGQGKENRACLFCGYRFDHAYLGKYGCPNCEGDPDGIFANTVGE